MNEKLPGEGETRIVINFRRTCDVCGAPATKRVTFLLDNARSNPASKGYGRDDCTWASDSEAFACAEHQRDVRWSAPDGMTWCSTFDAATFPHMFLFWETACNFHDSLGGPCLSKKGHIGPHDDGKNVAFIDRPAEEQPR